MEAAVDLDGLSVRVMGRLECSPEMARTMASVPEDEMQ